MKASIFLKPGTIEAEPCGLDHELQSQADLDGISVPGLAM